MGAVSLALLGLLLCSGLAQAVVRTYYIAAEEVEWDYLPSNKDQFRGVDYMLSKHARVFCEQGDDRIGKVYRKAMYFEYTDASFTQKVARPNWMGFLGPAIRAEVGDTIEVHFHNKATLAYSIHPHGVFYDKNNEGALYADGTKDTTGDAIYPGKNYTYKWEVRERSGPGPNDMSSILWSYHSHVLESQDIYSGLIGPMIIYRQGTLGPNGLPVGIDREYILLLMVFDENQSRYISTNIKNYCGKPDTVDTGDDDFVESNLMHGINGYFYCNLNDMFMCEGETVRWYTFAFGTEVDLHTVHWHGQTLLMDGHRMDVLELLPATMRTLDMTVDNPGNWLLHCHVNDHAAGGMQAYFQVASKEQCAAGYKAWL